MRSTRPNPRTRPARCCSRLRDGMWDEWIVSRLGIPMQILPEVLLSSGRFGDTILDGRSVPVSGIAGDQQAALVRPSVLLGGHGEEHLRNRVVRADEHRGPGTAVEHAACCRPLRGTSARGSGTHSKARSSSTGAAIQWLRDGLGIISDASEAGPLAGSVPDTGGTYLVPAFVGLGAPHWDPYARGAFVGITRGTTSAHLARAAVEAMAYQTRDVVDAMTADTGKGLDELRVDGGASVMDLLCQFQADQLGVVVRRPAMAETTALGAAFLAGLAEGVWTSTEEISSRWRAGAEFEPTMPRDQADELYAGWTKAIARAREWAT